MSFLVVDTIETYTLAVTSIDSPKTILIPS